MLRELGLFKRRGWPWGESREPSLAPRKGKENTQGAYQLWGTCGQVLRGGGSH